MACAVLDLLLLLLLSGRFSPASCVGDTVCRIAYLHASPVTTHIAEKNIGDKKMRRLLGEEKNGESSFPLLLLKVNIDAYSIVTQAITILITAIAVLTRLNAKKKFYSDEIFPSSSNPELSRALETYRSNK